MARAASERPLIAKAFQAIAGQPFLHVQMDGFLDMMPPALANHHDGFHYENIGTSTRHEIAISEGPAGTRTLRGMRAAVAAMAGQGNNLIVDDVMLGTAHAEYLELLIRHQVITVGIFAALDILEERERQRDDHMIGLARWQLNQIHAGIRYDLEIDASTAAPEESAERIKAHLGL